MTDQNQPVPSAAGPSGTVPVAGSERTAVAGARRLGPVDADQPVTVTVVVRPRPGSDLAQPTPQTSSLRQRRYLSREEFAARSGADPTDLDRVAAFAGRTGLSVVESSAARRTVRLSGTAAAMGTAFGVDLGRWEHGGSTFRGRTGPVHVPTELAEVVQAVLGLDERAQSDTHFTLAAAATTAAVTAPQLARLYDFPTEVDGTDQCIAIIELGGGYRDQDLQTYFSGLGLPVPAVVAVPVDGAANSPTGSADGPDGEVLLDIEVAGSVAPGARIAVYFAPNTDAGFLDAVTTAVHDRTNAPSVVSISWGAAESQWTAQAAQAMDAAFADAAQLGVTVCVASGDNGAADRVQDGLAHADFPASSPHVLGCGGTVVDVSDSALTGEAVWNDGRGGASGGGVSDLFDLPDYQQGAGVPPSVNPGGRVGRGVPDVCGDADPASGYRVVVDGQQLVIGGTSAVAPLWAGLVALLNQSLGTPVGHLNPLLYATAGPAPVDAALAPAAAGTSAAGQGLVDITSGDNRVSGAEGYDAGSGWDACTGLGRPDGAALLTRLSARAG